MKEDDGKLGRSNERLSRIERSVQYVVHDGLTIKMNPMAQDADGGVCRSSTAM